MVVTILRTSTAFFCFQGNASVIFDSFPAFLNFKIDTLKQIDLNNNGFNNNKLISIINGKLVYLTSTPVFLLSHSSFFIPLFLPIVNLVRLLFPSILGKTS